MTAEGQILAMLRQAVVKLQGHLARWANGINEKDLQLPFDDLNDMQRWRLLIFNGIGQPFN